LLATIARAWVDPTAGSNIAVQTSRNSCRAHSAAILPALVRRPLARGYSSASLIFASDRHYLIASGLIGEPVPPVMTSGGPANRNS
jgi:hypothetical protein